MCKRSSLQELEFIYLKEAVVHIFLESLLAFTTQLLHPAKPVTRCEVCNPHLLHALHLLQTLHHLIPHSPKAEFCVFFILIECPKAVPIIGVSPVFLRIDRSNLEVVSHHNHHREGNRQRCARDVDAREQLLLLHHVEGLAKINQ